MVAGTYGLHDNPNKCQSFSHENRRSDYPAAKYRTPDYKMSLCNACKKRWERDNWPQKCVPYEPTQGRR